jgi:hypothetical protein
MDWGQKSKLIFFDRFSKENSFDLSEKAIAIYEHIQLDSKTFSLDIFNKLATVKNKFVKNFECQNIK